MDDKQREVIASIVDEIALERENHLAKWGVQDHPPYLGEQDRRTYAKLADYYKQIWKARKQLDSMAWDVILLEEVYEALSESDDLLRREELIQVAAVAAAEIEAIDRRLQEQESLDGLDLEDE